MGEKEEGSCTREEVECQYVINNKNKIATNAPGMVASMHESYKPEFWFGSQVSG